jgi:hypothetical protein
VKRAEGADLPGQQSYYASASSPTHILHPLALGKEPAIWPRSSRCRFFSATSRRWIRYRQGGVDRVDSLERRHVALTEGGCRAWLALSSFSWSLSKCTLPVDKLEALMSRAAPRMWQSVAGTCAWLWAHVSVQRPGTGTMTMALREGFLGEVGARRLKRG